MQFNTAAPALINSLDWSDENLGRGYIFKDKDLSGNGSDGATILSAMPVYGIVVKNVTNGVLLAGTAVKFDTGSTYGPFKAVSAKAGDDEEADGVVAPYIISTGVPINSNFILVVDGPALVQHDGAANVATAGLFLQTAAAGRVRLFVEGTDDEGSRFARSLAVKASGTAGDLFRAYVKAKHV